MEIIANGTATIGPARVIRADAPHGRIVFGHQVESTNRLSLFKMSDANANVAPSGASIYVVLINSLVTKRLRMPLSVLIERDGEQFLAQTVDFPLYALGDTPHEAIDGIQHEIESLYQDLMVDDGYSAEWLNRKKLLTAIVVE